jgi:hypothetical protein
MELTAETVENLSAPFESIGAFREAFAALCLKLNCDYIVHTSEPAKFISMCRSVAGLPVQERARADQCQFRVTLSTKMAL